MNEWDAEVELDEAQVRSILAAQHPGLDVESAMLRQLGVGWDNAVWELRPSADAVPLALRFPRRAVVVAGVERELRLLARVEQLVPLAVPAPRLVGTMPGEGRWPYFGAELIPGRELWAVELGRDDAVRVARQVGAFLRALHDPATLDAVDPDASLPVDPNRRADMPYRTLGARATFARLEDGWLTAAELRSVEAVLEDAAGIPADPRLVLAHGDLHLRHVLVHQRRATGVIDWTDIGRAPAAIDLMLAWSSFEGAARAALLNSYGAVDEHTILRARVLALHICGLLAEYAHHEHLTELRTAALEGIRRTLRP